MITIDTSALYVLLHRADQDHARVRAALRGTQGPRVIPVAILGEATYLIEGRLGSAALDAFVSDLLRGGYALDCGEHDLPRVRELIRRYADFPLGFVDAAVIACAERRGGRVLTLDLRHFGVVAREGAITILP